MTAIGHPVFRLGIITGIASEARTLAGRLPNSGQLSIQIELSAATPLGARRAVEALKSSGCTHLLSWGLAGALDPALQPGFMLLPRCVVVPAGHTIAVNGQWHEMALRSFKGLSPSTASILGVDKPITTIAEKAELHRRHVSAQVGAIDMESHILGELAKEAGLPFLIIRVIVDSAGMMLPPAAQGSITVDGKTDIKAVLLSLARHPAQLPELIRLGQAAGKAISTLLRCADMAGSTGFGIL